METTVEYIVKMCYKLYEKKIDLDKFNDFLQSLKINKRLNFTKKGMIISMAISDLNELKFVTDAEGDTASDMEKIYVTRFILSYVDTGYEFYQITDDDMEVMYETGLIDYILNFCERDFNIMKRMFENAIKFKYLNMAKSLLSDISSSENTDNINKVVEIFNDDKKMETVAEIMRYNDPALKALKDEIFKSV